MDLCNLKFIMIHLYLTSFLCILDNVSQGGISVSPWFQGSLRKAAITILRYKHLNNSKVKV